MTDMIVLSKLPSRELLIGELKVRYGPVITRMKTGEVVLNNEELSFTSDISRLISGLILHEDEVVPKCQSLMRQRFTSSRGRQRDFLELERKLITTIDRPPMLLFVVSYMMHRGDEGFDVCAEQYFINKDDARQCFDKRALSHTPEMGFTHPKEYFMDEEHRQYAKSFRVYT